MSTAQQKHIEAFGTLKRGGRADRSSQDTGSEEFLPENGGARGSVPQGPGGPRRHPVGHSLPRKPPFSGTPCRRLFGTLRARRARKTLLAGRGFPKPCYPITSKRLWRGDFEMILLDRKCCCRPLVAKAVLRSCPYSLPI